MLEKRTLEICSPFVSDNMVVFIAMDDDYEVRICNVHNNFNGMCNCIIDTAGERITFSIHESNIVITFK